RDDWRNRSDTGPPFSHAARLCAWWGSRSNDGVPARIGAAGAARLLYGISGMDAELGLASFRTRRPRAREHANRPAIGTFWVADCLSYRRDHRPVRFNDAAQPAGDL